MGDSYYELLGVGREASGEEIEQAYREKLKETHPDVSDDEDASERTKRLIEAKEVLTDETERARYDRLGHDAYVDGEVSQTGTDDTGSSGEGATRTTTGAAATAGSRGGSTSGTTATGTGSTYGTAAAGATGGTAQATSGGGQASARTNGRGRHVRDDSWYDGNPDDSPQSGGDSWRAWDNDGSYAVNRDGDSYQHGRMFDSQRSLILLVSTFAVYPVLLFGALLPQFPLAVNLTVAMCVVLVIAFLQSIPEVGIAVFGLWSLLLPVTMFWLGIDFLTVRAFMAVVAVVFPFGLSVLTRVAIRPISAG